MSLFLCFLLMHFMDATDLIEMHLFVGISTKGASLGLVQWVQYAITPMILKEDNVTPEVFEESRIDA